MAIIGVGMSDTDETDDEPEIVRSQVILGGDSVALPASETDTISPTAIHHHVDEFPSHDGLIQRYNYYVYHFEIDGYSIQARAYVETMDEVALIAQPNDEDTGQGAEAMAFRDDVLRYLKRRFDRILELGEEGYVTVWQRSDR